MATKHGKLGVVKLGAAGGNATVLQLKGWSYDEKVDTPDSTVAGAAGKTHEVGISEWSGTIDVLFDPTDIAGQGAMTIGAEVVVNFYDYGTTAGNAYKYGTATIESIGKAGSVDGVQTRKYGIKGQGALADGVAA